MPVQLLLLIIATLTLVLIVRRLLRVVVVVPSVFLHLALGIGLGYAARSELGQHAVPILRDTAALATINSIGWIGCLLLLALGSQPASDGGLRSVVPRRHIAGISLFGFAGTFVCATAIGWGLSLSYPTLMGVQATRPAFSMAIGLACAVTALPVLVSLLHESQQDDGVIGQLALHVAVLDDLWMWTALAFVVGSLQAESSVMVAIPIG